MKTEQQQTWLKATPDKGFKGGGTPPLGIYAKSADFLAENRLAAFAAQSVARGVLPKSHRLSSCLRLKVSKTQPVGVKYAGKARYHGLQTCGSVWACPVCARKISEHRRHELSKALTNWRSQGGSVYLLTLTFPHQRHDDLSQLLVQFAKALSAFKSTAAWRRFNSKFEVAGNIRALEVTHGVNGWHPHAHHLVFSKSPQNLDAMKEEVRSAWAKSCIGAGLKSPSDAHGVDVRGGDYAAKYVGKWGLEHEVTKAHLKKGKQGGMTPFDLLRVLLDAPTSVEAQRAPALFREYAGAFHGRRQLYWSDGLRALLGLEEAEVSDEQAAQGVDDGAALLASLTDAQWRFVVGNNLRGELLEAVNKAGGSPDSVSDFLDALAETQPVVEQAIIDPHRRVRVAPKPLQNEDRQGFISSSSKTSVEGVQPEHPKRVQREGCPFSLRSEFSGANPKGESCPSSDPEKSGRDHSPRSASAGTLLYAEGEGSARFRLSAEGGSWKSDPPEGSAGTAR